jgi:hypothetical protein
MIPKILSKWNIYIMSLGSLDILNSKVYAPRIGLCSNNIEIQSSEITSSGKGCKKDSGLGAGITSKLCSGSGASHGGKGGYGSPDTNDEADV